MALDGYELRYPFGEAYGRLRVAQDIRTSAPDDALAQLDAAMTIFSRLDATRYVRRVEKLRAY